MSVFSFLTTYIKITPTRMQILVCFQTIVLALPSIHIYVLITQIAMFKSAFFGDETTKLFLVSVYNIIISIATSSSLRWKYFQWTAYFLLFYFIGLLVVSGVPLLPQVQNLIMMWLIILSSGIMLKHSESEDRMYFALVKKTQKVTREWSTKSDTIRDVNTVGMRKSMATMVTSAM
jgi:hypothetical protein